LFDTSAAPRQHRFEVLHLRENFRHRCRACGHRLRQELSAGPSLSHARIHSSQTGKSMTASTEAARVASRDTPAAIPVHGIIDVSNGRGYLRTAGYRRSPADIPLTPGQLRQHGLRQGDHIEGKAAERRLTAVTTVSGWPADQAKLRPHFDDLTPIYPRERLRLETGDASSRPSTSPPTTTSGRRNSRSSGPSAW
jgi:transcription termination factor Rho